MQMRNPFQFQHVEMLKQTHNFEYSGPCVVMATPSGMQNGISREFFEMWCQDTRNSCIICDFAVQGTLAREVMGGPSHTMTRDGKKVRQAGEQR